MERKLSEDSQEPESPYWHGKKPFVEFFVSPWPWRNSETYFNPAVFIHRTIFLTETEPHTTALVKEGPKSLLVVKR